MKIGSARLCAFVSALTLCLFTHDAEGALTSSEKGQIRDFVVAAKKENAQRVRSLVARTDLSQEESVAVLSEAVAPAPWTTDRAVFLKELMFGSASEASRPLVAFVVTMAALARADMIHQKYVGGLDHEPKAIAELTSIYAFLVRDLAAAGSSSGISPASLQQCAQALREHLERNGRWLKGDAKIAENVTRLRAQAQVALYDLLPDGTTRRFDAADRIGLRAARKKLLVETGVLLADGAELDDAAVDRVRAAMVAMPKMHEGLEVIVVGDDAGPRVTARGFVLGVGPPVHPFGPEVTESKEAKDDRVSAILLDLSVLAARQALTRADFRDQVAVDAANTKGDMAKLLGRPRGPGLEHVLGSAMATILADTQRSIDSSFVRMLAAKPEVLALFSDALGAMQVSGTVTGTKKLTAIKLAPNGAAVGFAMEGRTWTIDRTPPSFAVTGATVDGKGVALADLPTAKTKK